MNKGLVTIFVVSLIVLPLAIFGCKSKVEKESEMANLEATVPTEEVLVTQTSVTEPMPAQTVSQETIPPTASMPAVVEASKALPSDMLTRSKEIQTALKAAGFYTGAIDGKIGPKTKKAIVEFQKAKGLTADGRVGPKTWSELENYLKQ